MLGERPLWSTGLESEYELVPDYLSSKLVHKPEACVVSRTLADFVVEYGVEIVVTSGLARVGGNRHVFDDVAQHPELILGGASSGQRGAHNLDRHPSLGNLDSLVDGERLHSGTFVWLKLDEALEREPLQG